MQSIEVSSVRKTYGNTHILNNVALNIPFGKITGLFGRNGSGKSTLLKIIFGTLRADAISMHIDAIAMKPKMVINSKKIAYLPQHSFLPKELTVRQVIPMFYANGKEQDAVFYAKGVSSFEKQLVGKLSMGQLRYLELLLVGNLNHKYIMLDEPFSTIEPLYKEIIKAYIWTLKQTKGIILTDHYYNDVLEITDTNYIIKEGYLTKIKTKEDLLRHHYLNRID